MSVMTLDVTASAFETPLGWMALSGKGGVLTRLVMGHDSARAALAALSRRDRDAGGAPFVSNDLDDWQLDLVARVQAYCEGAHDDFRDVRIDDATMTAFQRRVLAQCRRIPAGRTQSYAQLAAKAGAAGASRAVGNVMANNRFPLVVPCHRVVGSSGLGGFSAPHGLQLKRKLLELEGALPIRAARE